MKSTGFTKYIPITEAEYQKFRELQNKETKLVQEEIERPPAVIPLVETQKEKTQTIFTPSNNPELQEQRYMHLVNIMNELKRQVEQRQLPAHVAQQQAQTAQAQQQPSQHLQLQQTHKRPYKKAKRSPDKVEGFAVVKKDAHKKNFKTKPKLKMQLRSTAGDRILTDSRTFRQFMNSL